MRCSARPRRNSSLRCRKDLCPTALSCKYSFVSRVFGLKVHSESGFTPSILRMCMTRRLASSNSNPHLSLEENIAEISGGICSASDLFRACEIFLLLSLVSLCMFLLRVDLRTEGTARTLPHPQSHVCPRDMDRDVGRLAVQSVLRL